MPLPMNDEPEEVQTTPLVDNHQRAALLRLVAVLHRIAANHGAVEANTLKPALRAQVGAPAVQVEQQNQEDERIELIDGPVLEHQAEMDR